MASAESSESGTDTNAVIYVTILEAEYGDYDDDSYVDDVYALIMFQLGYGWFYCYYYYITLTLPSGNAYTYLVMVYAWINVVITTNIFLDHGTESGNYTIDVEAILISPGIALDSISHTFDPPGGSEGGKPTFLVY